MACPPLTSNAKFDLGAVLGNLNPLAVLKNNNLGFNSHPSPSPSPCVVSLPLNTNYERYRITSSSLQLPNPLIGRPVLKGCYNDDLRFSALASAAAVYNYELGEDGDHDQLTSNYDALFLLSVPINTSTTTLPLLDVNNDMAANNNEMVDDDEESRDLLRLLPDEVVLLILNKVDVLTLCRCTAAAPRHASLVRSSSKSPPFPPRFPPPSSSLTIGTRPGSAPLSGLLPTLHRSYSSVPIPPIFSGLMWLCYQSCLNWLFATQTCPSRGRRFFQRHLPRLESLEVELPIPSSSLSSSSSADYYLTNSSWFRWDAEHYMYYSGQANGNVFMGQSEYFLVVHQMGYYEPNDLFREEGMLEILHQWEKVQRHIMYHLYTATSITGSSPTATLVSKDAGGNGSLRVFYNKTKQNINKRSSNSIRQMFIYVPATLALSHHNNNNNSKSSSSHFITGPLLSFVSSGFGDDDDVSNEDLIRACLGPRAQQEDDDARKELREVVTKILSHNNKIDVWDLCREGTQRSHKNTLPQEA